MATYADENAVAVSSRSWHDIKPSGPWAVEAGELLDKLVADNLQIATDAARAGAREAPARAFKAHGICLGGWPSGLAPTVEPATKRGANMAVPARRTESSSSARPVQRWDPFSEFEQLQEEMGRLVQSVWPQAHANGGAWMPLADIEETEDAWIIEAELPGVDRKDVDVELREGELVITGEIKEKERKGVVRRRTRRTGQFEYRVMLPGQANEDQIEANLHDGVLSVRVPKSEKAKPRRIEVKAS